MYVYTYIIIIILSLFCKKLKKKLYTETIIFLFITVAILAQDCLKFGSVIQSSTAGPMKSATDTQVMFPPAVPPFLDELHPEEFPSITEIIVLPPKKTNDEFAPKKTRLRIKKERTKIPLAEFLEEKPGKNEVPKKASKEELPKKVISMISPFSFFSVCNILGLPLMYITARNSFENVVNGLRIQLDLTVKHIMKITPGFVLTSVTPSSTINQFIDMVIAFPKHENRSNLYEMLRSILAIHCFFAVLSDFRSLKLKVSSEMCINALNYIEKNTNGDKRREFDATEFFLNNVPLDQRIDAIAALLCIAHCIRVEPNRKMGPHRFIVVMKVCPCLHSKVRRFLATIK